MAFGWLHRRAKFEDAVEATAAEFLQNYRDRASHLVRLQMVETAKTGDARANAFWCKVFRRIKVKRGMSESKSRP